MTTKDLKTRLKVELHGPSSGGVGKSSSALDSAAIARLSGYRITLLDADRGNAALSDSLHPKYDTKYLPHRYSEGYASELITSCVDREIDLLIIDLGANVMTDTDVEATIMNICAETRRQGGECRVYLSLQQAKRGLLADASLFAERFAGHADLFLNFRDGMDRAPYSELISKSDGVITVPNYHAAIQDLMKESRLLPDDWLAHPQPGFEFAAAMSAEALLERARQAGLREWIGSEVAERWLEARAADAPKRVYNNRVHRGEVTNERLKADERFLISQSRLMQLTGTSDDHTVLRFARDYISANVARSQVVQGF